MCIVAPPAKAQISPRAGAAIIPGTTNPQPNFRPVQYSTLGAAQTLADIHERNPSSAPRKNNHGDRMQVVMSVEGQANEGGNPEKEGPALGSKPLTINLKSKMFGSENENDNEPPAKRARLNDEDKIERSDRQEAGNDHTGDTTEHRDDDDDNEEDRDKDDNVEEDEFEDAFMET
jgi:hypothetical protein